MNRAPRAGHAPGPPGTRQARDLLRVAFGPSLVALVIIAAVVLLQLLIANSDMTGALGAIASMWLGVHQVPVSIGGSALGVMPLLPAMGMVYGTARTTASAVTSTSWVITRWVVASALGGPVLLTALCLAVIHDAASVLTELQTPDALRAFLGVVAVHAIGTLLGVGSRIGRPLLHSSPLPRWLPDAFRAAGAGVLALMGLSAAVVSGSLILHWSTMHDLYSITDSMVGQVSLTLLSVLYLPNVVVGAAAVAVGSSAHLGLATFSAFTVLGGDVPALPVLAAAPTPPLGPIWVALLIVAAIAAVALGQQCARRPLPPLQALAKVVIAAAVGAAAMALLGYAGGGALGNFGDVGVDQTTFGPAVFIWFAGIGALTVAMSGGFAPRVRRPKPAVVDEVAEPDAGPAADVPAADVPAADVRDADLPDDEYADVPDDEYAEPETLVLPAEPPARTEAEPAESPPPVPRPDPVDGVDPHDPEDHFIADDDMHSGRDGTTH